MKNKNYILIWDINDYAEMWWWTYYDFFDSKEEMELKINEITKDIQVSIWFCWEIRNQFNVKPVEKVTKWEIE